MRAQGASVSVVDIDPVRVAHAVAEGFAAATDMRGFIRTALVVGCTGVAALDANTLATLSPSTILASASSRDTEFAGLLSHPTWAVTAIDDVVSSVRRDDGTDLLLLGGGLPVNFLDGSRVGTAIDLTYAELLACARDILRGSFQRGLWDTLRATQMEIASVWLSFHGPETAS